MKSYEALNKQIFTKENYTIIPIRDEDKYKIMHWRNEQMYHLRQSKVLNKISQDEYFDSVISGLFESPNPNQLLFTYLEDQECIGYGGLVHINWLDKNAEISFVLNTKLENLFIQHWKIFLELIEQVGFVELNFHKLYTYAYDLRPNLYIALEQSNYRREAVLIQHTFFRNKPINVLIHSKVNSNKYFLRKAVSNLDGLILFDWVNDEKVRENSINSNPISIIDHFKWFLSKLSNNNSNIYILTDCYETLIGQIRVDRVNNILEIDYSISTDYRGMGFGNIIVRLLISEYKDEIFLAKVKKSNKASIKVFMNNGFKIEKEYNELLIFKRTV